MDIKVTKDEISAAIAAMPTFQKDGAFSFDLYQQLLKSNRMTPKDFEDGQKVELTLKKARQAIKDKATVTDEDALAQFKKENDRIDLEYVAYAPTDVIGEVKLTEVELNEYLQKNQAEFKTPEKVALSYIMLDPSIQAAKLTVTEEEIQTYYQKNIDKYQGKDGIQPLKDVKDRAKADALRQKAAKQSFELAADTLYKNIKSGDLGLVAGQLGLKVQEVPLFAANAPAAALAGEAAVLKKAFELKQGELGGPVETTQGHLHHQGKRAQGCGRASAGRHQGRCRTEGQGCQGSRSGQEEGRRRRQAVCCQGRSQDPDHRQLRLLGKGRPAGHRQCP